jgi:hypothetical protein
MPRTEFTEPEPKSDIYALLLVLSAVFILAATVITYIELATDYDWFKETPGGGAYVAPAEAPAPPAPVDEGGGAEE